MKIAIVVQARWNSTRLPGKVLTRVAGKPLLEYLLERLRRCQTVQQIIIATSVDPGDGAIAAFAKAQGVDCFRGSLQNVADRFRVASARYELDAFVRINGDSPLLDPTLIDQAVRLYEKHSPDLATNVHPRTFPKGESVEVVNVAAFQRALLQMSSKEDFEHVTHYFYQHPKDFTIRNFAADGNFGDVRFVVDTQSDLVALENVIERMVKPQSEYGWKDLLQLYKEAASWLRTSLG